jgi:hypothetical protein
MMMRVSLIGTVHEEQGFASISNLLAILECIQPEVIFLEIPSGAFEGYLDGTRSNLESTAARRYRESHNVVLVPVDLPTPEEAFFRNCQYLWERIEKASPEYRRLIDRNRECVTAYGFPYLCSEQCSSLWTDIYEATRVTVEQLNDRLLFELHAQWKNSHELRDEGMLKHIETYSYGEPFENGVFLVGAAHRQSIVNKSREARAAGLPKIEWDLSRYLVGSNQDGTPCRPGLR